MTGLALLGLGISIYLTYVHYAGIKPVCAVNGGCEKVQSSRYATPGGVPVALVGLIGYVAILVALLTPDGERSRVALVALTALGFGVSLYLTYLELFVIHAICQWCVGSAVLMTGLTAIAVPRFLRPPLATA